VSRIYFHSPSGTAEVSGRERAYAGMICNNLLFVALGISTFTDAEPYRKLLPLDSYVHRHSNDAQFFAAFRTWSFAQMGAMYQLPDGRETNVFEASLNTAVAMGSDPIRLLAKLHGQCEIHAYVEGPNRAWLADIIEQGVKDKILRVWENDFYGGWPAVVKLLRSRDDEPIVTSYSVTEQFPNRYIAQEYGEWEPDEEDPNGDSWYELPEEEQWNFAMDGLRYYNQEGTIEMKPETFAIQGYGDGLSGFDIIATLVR
jgi:hypothetical protein